MSPRDFRQDQSRPVRIPATPDGRGGWVPHLDEVDVGPGWVIQPDLGNPDPQPRTRFEQPGNVPRAVMMIRGHATRRV